MLLYYLMYVLHAHMSLWNYTRFEPERRITASEKRNRNISRNDKPPADGSSLTLSQFHLGWEIYDFVVRDSPFTLGAPERKYGVCDAMNHIIRISLSLGRCEAAINFQMAPHWVRNCWNFWLNGNGNVHSRNLYGMRILIYSKTIIWQ